MTLAQQPDILSLRELNARIKRLLNNPAVTNCWVRADLSDVHVRGGHCYCELIEKDEQTGSILARIRGIIWRSSYYAINAKFRAVTGQDLGDGMKVLLMASVNYHEQFGISLIINDIDPSYTLGDMERQRREIIARLQREGIFDDNRQLAFPDVPQRIAIVSAKGAAGYGDFINQLYRNPYKLKFYTALFSAIMQGQNTVPTVLNALDSISKRQSEFDCVVIIRGGGSTADLHSFDNYELAKAVTQMPLPVLVGIGHDRDTTVLDFIAACRVKTPTAAAEWLIDRGANALAHIEDLSNRILEIARERLNAAHQKIQDYYTTIPLLASRLLSKQTAELNHLSQMVPVTANSRVTSCREKLVFILSSLTQASHTAIERAQLKLSAINDKIEILSPQNTLKRGYSLTTLNGRTLTDASAVKPGDLLTTHLRKGEIHSTVN